MKNVLDFTSFINENKEDKSSFEYIHEDIMNIIDIMFIEPKSIQFKVDKKFISEEEFLKKKKNPKSVKFQITDKDYSVGYPQPLNNDYSKGVLKKRDYDVTLLFHNKWQEGDKNWIQFDINLKKIKN